MDLKNLIEAHLNLARLSAGLDDLGHFGRLWSVRQWTGRHMALLWEALQNFRPTTLDDFVPPSVGPLVEVIHYGKNSLPVATRFEKRFCRPRYTAGDEVLVGFNAQPFSALTGPGYFVAHPAMGAGAAAEVAIDYTIRATERASSWPPIQPSSRYLGRFVYGGAIDVVRGLSRHVTIGRVRMNSGWKDTWFVLVRQDVVNVQPRREP
ncbi:MAG TPA: hypothetical protein VEK07_00100 [Polyangiaceae bacterium]|nr:hypothetical protein [Polyangiaceae bacterium]